MCAASLLFPLGAPIKLWTNRLWGLGGSVHWEGCGCWPATLPTSSSSSELLTESSGLVGHDREDHREGGHDSSSSSVYCVAWYLSLSLSESITISRISFWDSTQARFAHKTPPRCIVNKTSVQLTHKQQNLYWMKSKFCKLLGGIMHRSGIIFLFPP